MGARGGVDAGDGDSGAGGAVPGGDPVAPPELAADAPVVDVLHPVEVGLLVHLRGEFDGAGLDGFNGEAGHGCAALFGLLVDGDEPLRGKARLDYGFAAVAVADAVGVVADAGEEALLFEISDDALAGNVAVEACVRPTLFVDVRGLVHDVDVGQIVALAQLEVVGVVGRRDFDGAGAEVAADPGVEDDGNDATD